MVRRQSLIVALLLVMTSVVEADEPKPFSVFARSQHYSMNIDVVPFGGDGCTYAVTIVDLATNAVVLQPTITTPIAERPVTRRKTVGNLEFRISIFEFRNELNASFDVTDGETILDSLNMRTSIAPHPRVLTPGVVGGVIGGVVTVPRPVPPGVLRVGGDVTAPVVMRRVEPEYTAVARKAQIQGVVIVEAIIDKTGFVRDVQVLKPLPFGLDQSAVDAVKQWRFEPGKLNGQPVDVVYNLMVEFKLNTPPPPQ